MGKHGVPPRPQEVVAAAERVAMSMMHRRHEARALIILLLLTLMKEVIPLPFNLRTPMRQRSLIVAKPQQVRSRECDYQLLRHWHQVRGRRFLLLLLLLMIHLRRMEKWWGWGQEGEGRTRPRKGIGVVLFVPTRMLLLLSHVRCVGRHENDHKYRHLEIWEEEEAGREEEEGEEEGRGRGEAEDQA